MKLGLYGGGFKPFHTGHFAKLLLALDEADKVISFFGIKKQKFSKKTGKPLKTAFRSFGNKPDARLFNQEMQEEVVSIYEDALENAFPGNLDIVPSADETPIRKIFNVLSNFAYQNMTPEEREEVREEVPQVYAGQNLQDFNMNQVDEIVVVAGQEELDKTYLSGIDRQAEKSEIGRKIKDLIDSGKIRFETGAGDQQRLVGLLKKYREDAGEEHVLVRGTDVRNFAGDGNVDSLLNYIPSVVPEEQRAQLVKILVGDKAQNERFFMPIITDTTVLRAAARFASSKASEKTISEQKKKGEGHILGLTEDMSLTFDALKSLISDVLSGRVEHIEEKMDGQNLTFTVLDNGEIRLFGKGVTSSALDKGGKGKADLEDAYGKNENLLDAFSSAYDVVEKYLATKDAELIRSLFQDGRVVIEGQIMTPINPNTIPYTENHVRFVRPFTPDALEIDMDAYRDVFGDADVEIQDQEGRPWSFGPVPKLEQVETDASEIQSKIEELERDIDDLIGGISPTPKTVGDYASHAMERYIDEVTPQIKLGSLSADQKKRALERLATGNKSAIGKKELAEFWPEVQKFEKLRTAHVAAAIADLEKIVQKLGTYFFDTLEFALATNDSVVADLAAEVEKIKQARAADSITIKNVESGDISDLVDTSWATKLDSSLSRVEQMDLFKKAVEGVVLRMPDAEGNQIVRKLTGMFTPIHRLVSLFRYPDRYSKQVLSIEEPDEGNLTDDEVRALNEALRLITQNLRSKSPILEGGNAFRPRDEKGRPTGPPVTTDERISRDTATKIIEEVVKNVISPLGIAYLPVGSTATNKSDIGDVDLTVGEPDIEKLLSDLKGLPYLSAELVEGIPRVVKLPGGRAATIMIEYQGKYYQVDLFTSTDIEDTAWELSGGGEGEVKGVYRNLILSLLAKIKGERDSSAETTMKYTISFPGGWRERVNGKENPDGRIVDPDEYLPLIGIDISKSDIRNFESLVDYMVSKESDIFAEALQRFEEYISNRANAKSEKTRNEASQAIKYVAKSQTSDAQNLNELYDIIELLLESEGNQSGIPFAKVMWSESLKMFPGVWENRTSASASGGKDEEGAEKAVAISENLIHLANAGYTLEDVGDGIVVRGKGDSIKLDKKEALEYMLGLGVNQSLPRVKIKHVPGLEKYDLLMIEGSRPMEVKKMAGRTVFSKLGSSTGRNFEMGVKILKPMRSAASIATNLLADKGLVEESTGKALVREVEEFADVKEIAEAVEAIDYLFFKSRFGTSPKELRGVALKIDSGQFPSGLVKKIVAGEILDTPVGNCLELAERALSNTLGEYSPTSRKSDSVDMEADTVDVEAKVGDETFDGKVSLDYFYSDLIFKLYDSELDEIQIPEEKMKYYSDSLELIASIYQPLKKISEMASEDVFDDFIESLIYSGLYGVRDDSYFVTPCDPSSVKVYSTTQGFRALLQLKSEPSEIIELSSPKQAPDEDGEVEEIDLEPAQSVAAENPEGQEEDQGTQDNEQEST